MFAMYGIKNCSTVKKAMVFLDEHNIPFEFQDFKKQPPTREQIMHWLTQIDWQVLLNMRGMTWRKLTPEQKEGINQERAIELMLEKPSIIKRPILKANGKIRVGFDSEVYAAL